MNKTAKIRKARKLLDHLTAANTLYRKTPKWIKAERAKLYSFLKSLK